MENFRRSFLSLPEPPFSAPLDLWKYIPPPVFKLNLLIHLTHGSAETSKCKNLVKCQILFSSSSSPSTQTYHFYVTQFI